MIWFLSFLATSFLMGIAALFALDQPRPDSFGAVSRPPALLFRRASNRVVNLRPMAAAGSEKCLDDF